MQVQLRAMNLSPLGLLVVALTSLPGYLLVTLAVLLAPNVFLSLLGALIISHGADRLLTRVFTSQPDGIVEKMQRGAIDMVNSILPGVGETVVSPSTRRLTAMLSVLVAAWYSESGVIVAVGLLVLGAYVEYVEQQRSFLSIFWGLLSGAVGAAPFVYWLFF